MAPKSIGMLMGLSVLTLVSSACGLRVAPQSSGTVRHTNRVPTTSTKSTTPSSATGPTIANDPIAAVNLTYSSFLSDVSALDDQLSQSALDALGQVATPAFVKAANMAASAIAQAHEHAVGALADSHRQLRQVSSTEVSISGCLDEVHWYVVSDGTDQPDPSVTRGYFSVSGQAVLEGHSWLINVWRPSSTPCAF
jgi:hypothetical protein